MAAEGSSIGSVLEKVCFAPLKELRLIFCVKKDLRNLQDTLSTVRSVIGDAQRRSVRNEQLSYRLNELKLKETKSAASDEDWLWLKELEGAALDADEVVEEFEIEALRRQVPINFFRQVCHLFSPRNPIVFRHKMANKIEDMLSRLHEIMEMQLKFKLVYQSALKSHNRDTHSVEIESNVYGLSANVYGREQDKQKVIHFLFDNDNDEDISIVLISGVRGVGKTTLAQLVFNDTKIKNYFEINAWVSMSETFELPSIIINILQSITRDKSNFSTLQAMQQKLPELLSNRKLLLVLDDVSNENIWESIKFLFNNVCKGSKILITTRNDLLATMKGPVRQHHRLQGLSADDCWAMYKQSNKTEKETPTMIKIAKEIFTSCGGLPIIVKAIGSLLGSKIVKTEWLSIKANLQWHIKNNLGMHVECTDFISSALRLSYDNLPSQVKRCFLYCALFPKDSILDKERLIKLWISEGLIPSANLEDACDKYLKVLSSVSFFQVGKTDYSGNIVSYKMLDIVHELACRVAGDESFIVKAGSDSKRSVPLECRYMSVVTDNVCKGLTIPEADYKYVKLRTFLTSRSYFRGIVGIDWGMMPTRLHVLDLSFTSIGKLPDVLDILKYLRFLDLSWTEIRTIPDSIISLQKLQTLYLMNCYQLQQLPEGIVFLSSLRHLDISGCYKLTRMPRGIGRLTNLRTLPTFIVGKERGRTIMELEHLNQIRGKLQIDGLHCVKDVNEAVQAKLAEKTELESLDLRWAWSASSSSSGDDTNKQENSFLTCMKKISFPKSKGSIPAKEEDVLERLQPPNNLKELRIIRYAGTRFPSWMTTTTGLPYLVTIVLFDIKRCERLPLGHLPSLRLLSLYCMPDLVEWSTEPTSTGSGVESIYPCLERLLITNCPKLASLPEGLLDLTALWELHIERCPLLRIQSQRKISGEWRNTFEEDDFVAQETEKNSSREEIEEELQE